MPARKGTWQLRFYQRLFQQMGLLKRVRLQAVFVLYWIVYLIISTFLSHISLEDLKVSWELGKWRDPHSSSEEHTLYKVYFCSSLPDLPAYSRFLYRCVYVETTVSTHFFCVLILWPNLIGGILIFSGFSPHFSYPAQYTIIYLFAQVKGRHAFFFPFLVPSIYLTYISICYNFVCTSIDILCSSSLDYSWKQVVK